MKINEKDYILTKVKLNIFYSLYNATDIKYDIKIKEMFSYKKIKENNFVFDDYKACMYSELSNMLYECLEKQLQIIYEFFYNSKEDNIKKIYSDLPSVVRKVIDKNKLDEFDFEDIIRLKEEGHSLILYYLMNFSDYTNDILEMIFETEKYEALRRNFLGREDGVLENKLLQQIKNIKYGK